MKIATPQRVFINPTYGVGDLVMLLPVLHSLRENDVEVGLFSSKRQSPLTETIAHLVDNQSIQATSNTRVGHFHAMLAAMHFNPDVILLLSRSYPLAFASKYLGFRAVFASSRSPKFGDGFDNIESLEFSQGTHRVEINMGTLDYLGLG